MRKFQRRALSTATALAMSFTMGGALFAAVPTLTASAAADDCHDDWLHCEGDRIFDMNGNEVWLTGANWFGFNCTENVFHGAWYDVKGILTAVADKGIGLIRVPISSELLYSWMEGTPNPVSSVTASNNPPYHVCNPDFENADGETKNSLEIFDYVMQYCKELGVKILLDVHSPASDNSGHTYPLWYGADTKTAGELTTEKWQDTLVWVADRYKDDDTLIALDLENEPHGKRGYDAALPADVAIWDDSTKEQNWKYAAETCGKAILDVNPNILILVEGIEQYPKEGYTFSDPDVFDNNNEGKSTYYGAWWGGNLRGVRKDPIDFGSSARNAQLVYSPHDYGPSVYNQTWFDKDFTTQTLLDDYWYDTWAYVDAEHIAPLLIGEWGGHMDDGKNQKWMTLLRDYMIKNTINHTFWCINPNSGDTGGLIGNDWSTWDDAKYSLFEESLWQDASGKYIGLDHKTVLGANGTNVTAFYENGGKAPSGGGQGSIVTTPPTTGTTSKVTTTITNTTTSKLGDLDADGDVDISDLILLNRYLVNTITRDKVKDLAAGDVNGDEKINALDCVVLKQYLAKIIKEFPV